MKYFLNLFNGGSVKEGHMNQSEINTMFLTLENEVSNLQVDSTLPQSSVDDLTTAINTIKTKLEATDNGLTADQTEFHSKRLAQNSRYYEKRYESYRNTAQTVLIATVIFVIISLISSYGLIPSSISTVLIPLMVGCFVFYLAYLYFDIAMRTHTDFDEYNFNRPGMDDRDNVGNE